MVRELLTTPLNGAGVGIRQPVRQPGEPTAVAFYQANELKAENLAASTSRLFLGVQLQCAQCHNHPFARWKREQFWEYAAFFAGIQQQGRGNGRRWRRRTRMRTIKIPDTDKTVEAKFLDGTDPKWQADLPAACTLADWVTAPANPYFARARVNRIWAQLFGLGLVEPVDDFSDDNPASHPELLDELAAAFVKSKFDTQFLIRALCAARRTSGPAHHRAGPGRTTRGCGHGCPLKGMTAEMLFDSVARATGLVAAPDMVDPTDPAARRLVQNEYAVRVQRSLASSTRRPTSAPSTRRPSSRRCR